MTIQRQSGLQLEGMASATYAWDAIQDIRVERGRFKVTLRDGKQHEAHASAIPNIELLCRLIGLEFLSPELAYF